MTARVHLPNFCAYLIFPVLYKPIKVFTFCNKNIVFPIIRSVGWTAEFVYAGIPFVGGNIY